MTHTVTLVPGDTTGPELCAAVQRVVTALGVDIAWDEQPMPDGQPTASLLASARSHGAVLMAYQRGQRDARKPAPIVALRHALGNYVNLRPVHSLPGVPSRFEGVDLVVVRELTEDIYAQQEHESVPGVFESLKVTTAAACERVARFAYAYARANGRRKVTIVHKSNIMKKSDGLFLRTARAVGAEYPDIQTDDSIVDALCMKLLLNPERFDVLLCGNLFGDIVSDVVAGIGGGPSACASVGLNPEGVALFSAPHGDPAEWTGTGDANPLGLFLPTVHLLRHLGESAAADRLQAGIERALAAGSLPKALGGTAGRDAFTDAVIAAL